MYATGVGSLPGTDFPGAVRHVLDAFEHAWLPELPARGVGADMVGRTTALLDGLGIDLQPAGWRLTDASGADHLRARALLRRDLDDLEEAAQGFTGSVRLTACGPWTLAARLERPRGDKVLADHGARREVADALASGLAGLVGEMRRRLPGVRFDVQLDEPMLPAVLGGRVPTASGFSRFRTVDRPVASELLQRVTGAAHTASELVVLHCCAPWPDGVDTDLAARSGIDALMLDASVLRARDWDALGPWLEHHPLVLGLAPTARADTISTVDQLVTRGLRVLRPLQLDPGALTAHLAVTTGCGLAGWTVGPAMRQLDALLESAPLVAEQVQR